VRAAARIREFLSLFRARLALMAGRRALARRVLKDAARRSPNSFRVHFMLGRLYWGERSGVKARREFDLAWQIDPERFERSYGRLKAHDEAAPEIHALADEPPERAPVLSTGRSLLLRGDFTSEREARRFAAMPPISREEIESIDWDRLESEFEQGG